MDGRKLNRTDMDDNTPVTGESLVTLGFRPYSDGWFIEWDATPDRRMSLIYHSVQAQPKWWELEGKQDDGNLDWIKLPDLPTVGHVRQFLAVLGVAMG